MSVWFLCSSAMLTKMLPDDNTGADDWKCNYLGFEGVVFEAVVDLEKVQDVSSVSISHRITRK